jgi:hypothetical protein
MATADFNGDGFPDVVTTDSTQNRLGSAGSGDGTFQPAVNYTVPQPRNRCGRFQP